ncbi:serpin family protein [Trichocoleus sp. FACHB-591]|uniref:serpin family protein n=1 Tax=Trichocoleus sp. FACHB-591 TaxID=2692872 RepID=UPI00168936FC|nr:serpin family protein [Trichocoleus sp. FACHB-591]MBD2094044.1 serpin family protein [Trichocoleus sp. FACHB-591]
MKTATDKLIAANNRFGFKLFLELLKQQPNQNIFVSPLSISIALSMLYNGAVGQTQAEMAIALGLQNMSVQEVNQANAELIKQLESLADVQVAIANSLWAAPNLRFRSEFLQRVQEFYQAEVQNLDFSSPNAAAIINQWASDQTHGKIQQIVQQLSPGTILVLLNAIYFKGNWSDRFDPTQTQPGTFTLLDSSQKQVPMMRQFNEYCCYQGEDFQAVRIPFKDKRLSLDIFLPPLAQVNSFYESLRSGSGPKWLNQFPPKSITQRLINLTMPSFQLEYETKSALKQALVSLGMKQAFDEAANFSQLCCDSAAISQITHKTFFEVNEAGAEAAAVTAIEMERGLPPTLIIDRSFFCAIRDQQTGAILFMGVIVDPG